MIDFIQTLLDWFTTVTFWKLLIVSFIISNITWFVLRFCILLLAKGFKHEIVTLVLKEIKHIPFLVYFFLTSYIILIKYGNYNIHDVLIRLIFLIVYLVVAYYLLRFISRVIRLYTEALAAKKKDRYTKNYYLYLSLIARILIWIFGLIFAFSNIGIDVTALITALGISGFAIAFAFRNLIIDVLGSFLIIFDDIVKVGDYISVEKSSGTVMKVGIKSVRIQTDEGEEVILPNSTIVDKAVINYKAKRRIPVSLTITISDYKKKSVSKVTSLLEKELINQFKSIRQGSLKIHIEELSAEKVIVSCSLVVLKEKGIDESVRDDVMEVMFDALKERKVGNISICV